MDGMVESFVQGLFDPDRMFSHLPYMLLILSMLMRSMVWLRIIAVTSGVAKIGFRVFFVFEPISILWETVFVLVNLGQLLLIWYYERHHRFSEDARRFAESMPSGADRRAIKRLLDLSETEEHAPDAQLTREGQTVPRLMFLADGVVKIERGGTIIAVCGPGDYVGELSFLSGNPASATAIVVKPARLIAFDQKRLAAATRKDTQLRRTLESALNQNLAGKLVRSNDKILPHTA